MTEPTPIVLRPYQEADIAALRKLFAGGLNRCVVYQLATGGGKTIIFCAVIASAVARGRRCAVITHRRELIRQASAKLTLAGVHHGIIAAGQDRDHDAPVLVCSIQTLANRKDLPKFDFIVIDEAHHARASTWHRFLASQPGAKLLGVTATPGRTDGKGLGIYDDGLFEALHCGPPIADLQAHGYLARTRCFIPAAQIDTTGLRTRHGDYVAEEAAKRASVITGDAVREYTRRCDRTPAIAFCCTIKHAENVAEAFRAAGYRAQAVHGGVPVEARDDAIASLGDGRLDVLTACEIISEGVDVPVVGATILLRPTKSLVMYLQQVGRGMRPAEGKEALIILDHASNARTHGLPEEERAWSLAGVPKRKKDEDEEQQERSIGWLCRHCDCLNPPGTPECADCGAANPRPRRIEQIDGDLEEALPAAQRQLRLERLLRMPYREVIGKPRSREELTAYAKARGYKRGWVSHVLRGHAERRGPDDR